MWNNCQIHPRDFLLSGIWAASAITLLLNPGAADAIHRAATGDRHCIESIAITGCGLDENQECGEHQYQFRPEAPRTHADLYSYQVVKKSNALSAHHSEFHTLGRSYMRYGQAWLVRDNPRPRQPKERNIVSGIHHHNSISSQGQLLQDSWVGTALLQPQNAMPHQYLWHLLGDRGSAQHESRCGL